MLEAETEEVGIEWDHGPDYRCSQAARPDDQPSLVLVVVAVTAVAVSLVRIGAGRTFVYSISSSC